MVDIISRAEWGARYGDGKYITPMPATEVILHHTVTVAPDLVPPFDDDDAAIRRIEDIGRRRFGEVYGFPYTWAVTPVGRIYQGHAVDKTGAHTAGHNTAGRGLAFVGNYQADDPTDPQIAAAAALLRHAHRQGWIATPVVTYGHRDLAATACPGINLHRRIDDINRLAAEQDPVMTPDLVIYARRGVDFNSAAAIVNARIQPGAVPVRDPALAQQALDAGVRVIALGGPAADDLDGDVDVVGADALESLIEGSRAAR